MREHLFKAKGQAKGKWHYGYLSSIDGMIAYINDKRTTWICDQNTVCEYTGLTDKNGVKIFEGDIIAAGEGKVKSHVLWDNNNNCWSCKNLKRNETYPLDRFFKRFVGDKIGNIFDNPELLESEATND